MTDSTGIKSILIVEDHPVFVNYLKRLISAAGISAEITETDRIHEAESLLAKNRYSCVLLDLTLKNGAGRDVIRRALKFAQPLVIVTAEEDPATRKMALQSGAQEFIEKSKLSKNGPEIMARLIENSIDRSQGVAELIAAYSRAALEVPKSAQEGAGGVGD